MFLNNINNSVFKVLLIFHSESQLKKSRGILLRRNNDTKVAIGKRRLFRGKNIHPLMKLPTMTAILLVQ